MAGHPSPGTPTDQPVTTRRSPTFDIERLESSYRQAHLRSAQDKRVNPAAAAGVPLPESAAPPGRRHPDREITMQSTKPLRRGPGGYVAGDAGSLLSPGSRKQAPGWSAARRRGQ